MVLFGICLVAWNFSSSLFVICPSMSFERLLTGLFAWGMKSFESDLYILDRICLHAVQYGRLAYLILYSL